MMKMIIDITKKDIKLLINLLKDSEPSLNKDVLLNKLQLELEEHDMINEDMKK